jgi:hypothetical protein
MHMAEENFDVPVTIETEHTGRHLTVTRVGQAARLLTERWPKKDGPKHLAAIRSVMAVIQRRKPVAEARKAFAEAAKEADIFIREGHHFGS